VARKGHRQQSVRSDIAATVQFLDHDAYRCGAPAALAGALHGATDGLARSIIITTAAIGTTRTAAAAAAAAAAGAVARAVNCGAPGAQPFREARSQDILGRHAAGGEGHAA
jgi:hypothetical protein